MKTTYKAFNSQVKLDPDDERCLIATISTTRVDRDGEVVISKGMRSDDFEGNPTVFFDHAWAKYGIPAKEKLPIGSVIALSRTEDSVDAKVRFTERPPTHPEGEEWLPDTILHLYKDRAMNGWSIGFDAVERRPPTNRDLEKYGKTCRLVTNKWDLVELSAVLLGCNPDALTTAVSKGIISQKAADDLLVDVKDAKESDGPEMGTCTKCLKEFPIEDMTQDGDEWFCDDCMEAMTAEDAKKDAPQPKHVRAAVDAADEPPVAMKRVHRVIETAEPVKRERKMHVREIAKATARQIKKMQGYVYDED